MYANCPIYWVSKPQTEIALSTAEAEYIALSQALREIIPLMTLTKELAKALPIASGNPNVVCKFHEDNQSCIKMASCKKFTPRTKHIALKHHHFKSHVKLKEILIDYCRAEDQKADLLTKPLVDELFFRLRFMLSGWSFIPWRDSCYFARECENTGFGAYNRVNRFQVEPSNSAPSLCSERQLLAIAGQLSTGLHMHHLLLSQL
ncbi:hypothetical protein ACHAWF_009124 [Thalassiosira exigua]